MVLMLSVVSFIMVFDFFDFVGTIILGDFLGIFSGPHV